MHVNTGYRPEALPLVRRFVAVFESYDVVVAPSGSCVGSVRHQRAAFARAAGDAALAGRAEQVASRTYKLSEFLVDVLGVTDVGAYPSMNRWSNDSRDAAPGTGISRRTSKSRPKLPLVAEPASSSG